jgi:hypothetical protein
MLRIALIWVLSALHGDLLALGTANSKQHGIQHALWQFVWWVFRQVGSFHPTGQIKPPAAFHRWSSVCCQVIARMV